MKKNLKLFLLVGLVASVGLTSCSKDEEVTPTPTPVVYGSINYYSAELLGGQNNATVGSFYSTSLGTVINDATASASSTVQSTIDFVYFYGTTNGASIGAPSDATVATAHTGSTSLPSWTVKNSTKFYITAITPAVFDAAMNDSLIRTVDSTQVTTSLAAALTVGKVVAFKTVAGKKGLFHVSAIGGTTGTDRNITLDVMVQD